MPLSDGLLGRLVILIAGLAIGIVFVLRYADRVKRDPSKSVVYDMKAANEARFRGDSEAGAVVLTGTHKAILAVFVLAFVVMIYGVIPWEDMGIGLPTWWWWFPEMTASFLAFSIIIGVIARMRERADQQLRRRRARPARGGADHRHRPRHHGDHEQRADHRHGPALDRGALGDTGEAAFTIVMFVLFLPLSFLIPSTSGLATLSMPITAPLAGFVDVPESLVVTAYQSASGVMNLFIPTSAVVMGGLAIARVPYGTYLRWVWPLLAALTVLCVVVLAVAAVLS